MTLRERDLSREKEKRKNHDLNWYSRNLTNTLLHGEKDIPEDVMTTFHTNSLLDREKANTGENFGTQMVAWIGRGEKPGIAQWVAKQSDADVHLMLQEVGLKATPEATRNDVQKPQVASLLATINADLAKVGQPKLNPQGLSEEEVRSLIFYSTYLTGKNGAEDTKSFINTLVSTAESQSNGDVTATIAKLQKITPLLTIAGEEAQYGLGALLVVKAHAHTPETMPNISQPLSEDEARAYDFLVQPIHPNALEEEQPAASENLQLITQQLHRDFQERFGKPYDDRAYLQGEMSDEEINFLRERATALFQQYQTSKNTPSQDATGHDDLVVVDEVPQQSVTVLPAPAEPNEQPVGAQQGEIPAPATQEFHEENPTDEEKLQNARKVIREEEDLPNEIGLAGLFGFLETQPHRGNNYYIEDTERLRINMKLDTKWKDFLLHNPKPGLFPNFGTFVLRTRWPTGTEVGPLDSISHPFLKDLLAQGTRSAEAERKFWQVSVEYYNDVYNNNLAGMNSTLFAFAADGAATPKEQADIFKKVGMQILHMYEANPSLCHKAQTYLNVVNDYDTSAGSKWPQVTVDELLGTPRLIQHRLAQLEDHLANQQYTWQDLLDISLLALPFDLSKLAKAMEAHPSNGTNGWKQINHSDLPNA